jgi:pimeloyl-ACP methyl ester carboxylesterase
VSAKSIEIPRQGGFFAAQDVKGKVLVVLLHAYNNTPKNLQRVAEVVREQYESSDIYVPKLPVHLFSWADPDRIAIGIVEALTNLPGIDNYESIILIGHSLGAVLARKVWVLALGATPEAVFDETRTRKWAHNIKRIILLAALSRGWMISSALDPFARLGWTLGTIWGHACRHVLGRDPVIFGFRRGAPFLTTVRLQCLLAAAELGKQGKQAPLTIQLLGTSDDYVAPTDNLDLATGQDFYYIEVTEVTHGEIVRLDKADTLQSFRLALTGSAESLMERSLAREDVFELFDEATDDQDISALPRANLKVKHVIFVIHGIRDRGFWTRRIAREVKSRARESGALCRAVTSTYGYFPMGPFLVPWMRRNKVEWLLDQYVMAKSLYPGAAFSYIGHSNGTYLLAKALEICPAVKFERVVFGGSVVRRGFEWNRYIPKQVAGVLNYVATGDNVVAVFPQGLERMRLQDLGGAGHNGFTAPTEINFRYVKGGHGACLAKDRWHEMADFALSGNYPSKPHPPPPQSKVTAWLGRLAPLIWFVLAALIFGIGAALLLPLGTKGAIVGLSFALYLYLVYVILTRA